MPHFIPKLFWEYHFIQDPLSSTVSCCNITGLEAAAMNHHTGRKCWLKKGCLLLGKVGRSDSKQQLAGAAVYHKARNNRK